MNKNELEKAFNELQEKFDAYKEETEKKFCELKEQNKSLSLTIGGLKTSNKQLRAKNDGLQSVIVEERENTANVEIKLEESLVEIEKLDCQLKEAEANIENFRQSLNRVVEEKATIEANVEYFASLPWWKKVLFCGKYFEKN